MREAALPVILSLLKVLWKCQVGELDCDISVFIVILWGASTQIFAGQCNAKEKRGK